MLLESKQVLAAELLETIKTKPQTANEILNAYFKNHRYIVGEDRQELLNIIWHFIRHWYRLTYAYPTASMLERVQFSQEPLPDLSEAPDWVRYETPAWLMRKIQNPEKELPPMLESAPIVLRANGNRDKIMAQLKEEGLAVEKCRLSPVGIVLQKYANLLNVKAYKKGLIEVQDEGAQLLSLDLNIRPHMSVFDFCAGAGGKSLIFAQMMQNKGSIMAYDASYKRLNELVKRAKRAGVSIIKTVSRLPESFKKFDFVVVDAPCSGTGTWRRTPDMRFKITPNQIESLVQTQADILDQAKEYVKNGHFLVYITCSMLMDENENQVERFLAKNRAFRPVKMSHYSPYLTQTDGFFSCVFQRG